MGGKNYGGPIVDSMVASEGVWVLVGSVPPQRKKLWYFKLSGKTCCLVTSERMRLRHSSHGEKGDGRT